MAIMVIGIMYIWYKEWCDLEKLEVQNRHIDTFRQESHEIFVLLIELSYQARQYWSGNMRFGTLPLSTHGNGQYAMPFPNDLSTERIDVYVSSRDTERQCIKSCRFLNSTAINDKITRQVP